MESNERIYKHYSPGYTLTLWLDGKPIKQKKNGKSNALFRLNGTPPNFFGIFRTTEDIICKAIEQSKYFKMGHIVRLASEEDIRLESLRKQMAEQRKATINLVENGLFNLDALEAYKADQLKKFAQSIGVDINTNKGVSKTKADIFEEVKAILFPGVAEKEVVSDDDDKEEKET